MGHSKIYIRLELLIGVWVGLWLTVSSCTSNQAERPYIIGFSQCTGGDAWRQAMFDEMQREISFYPNLELIITDAEGNNEQQLRDIDSLMKLEIDLLIISPNEAAPITPKVENVFRSGIPVVVVDRRTSSEVYSAYVGANNHEIGLTAGEYIGQLLNGRGKVLEIWGLKGSSPAKDRNRGFREGLERYPGVTVEHEVMGMWERDTAARRFSLHNWVLDSIDAVFAHNDVMATAARDFLDSMGYRSIPCIGVDGLPGPGGGINMVLNGTLAATLLYPTGGEEAIRLAADILQRRPVQKENILQTTIIDSTNVRIMKMQADRLYSQQLAIEKQGDRLAAQAQVYRNQRQVLIVVLISLILAVALAVVSTFLLREKQKNNYKLQVQTEEILAQRNQISQMAEAAEEAHNAKLKFFTNLSHELRTPLTLILGTVESMQRKVLDAHIQGSVKQIQTNSLRLLRLVTQLMDFRKVESGKMRLQATRSDLLIFVREISDAFGELAKKRKIDFRLLCGEPSIPLWFDVNKLDKVLFNLLSNAFKFTPEQGSIFIRIELDEAHQKVCLQVEDSGRGMSPQQAKMAFDRFFQVENQGQMGTGLGLALSKELIELHHGKISVDSVARGGTVFTIYLPMGDAHLKPEEKAEDSAMLDQGNYLWYGSDLVEMTLPFSTSTEKEMLGSRGVKSHRILLIEDNSELRRFVGDQLSEEYEVLVAADGEAGIKLAFEQVPDLVICDVMLPGESGLEVVTQLKQDLRSSHIPIILLTAQSSLDQQIKGIQAGADVYLTKPFSMEFLKEQSRTLLRNRERQRERYLSELKIESEEGTTPPQNQDREFINRFIALIEARMGDPDFNVQAICEELNLSRVQVYRKVKALLGYSVSDYLKLVRLKQGRQLLLDSDRPIAEVAESVGFASAAYFSTAFRNRYQQSPSEFRSRRSHEARS